MEGSLPIPPCICRDVDYGVMFAVGYSLAGWIGYGCYFSSKTSSFGFRFPLAFQCVPPVILLSGSAFLPFSPRWLLQQNRQDEAFTVLKRLHVSKEDPDGHEAKREFYQMRKQLELDRQIKAKTGEFDVFKTPSNRKRALFAYGLMFGNQFTGVLGKYVIASQVKILILFSHRQLWSIAVRVRRVERIASPST